MFRILEALGEKYANLKIFKIIRFKVKREESLHREGVIGTRNHFPFDLSEFFQNVGNILIFIQKLKKDIKNYDVCYY